VQIDPGTLDRKGRYHLMISILVPRPIAWISTVDGQGRRNLAPFSYFGGIASSPPLVGVSIARRRGAKKDTLRNLEETGEGVIHLPTEDLADRMVLTSGDFPPEEDEFTLAGLTPVASTHVRAPRIGEAPVAMECRVERIIELGDSGDSNSFVIARVVFLHVRDDLLEDGRVQIERFRPVGRLGGESYCRLRDVFEIGRPRPDQRAAAKSGNVIPGAASSSEGSAGAEGSSSR
jgi:flavin reductase (DIM6/NTAB) family NADH-FMN oxidoreductase RutF